MSRDFERRLRSTVDNYLDQVFELDGFVVAALEGFGSIKTRLRQLEMIHEYQERFEPIADTLKPIDVGYLKHLSWMVDAPKKGRTHQELLFSQAAVLLWSHVEAVCGEVALALLSDQNRARKCVALRQIKVAADVLYRSHDERTQVLYQELIREKKISFQPGIAGFEDILGDLGLGGSLSDEARRAFIELKEVRNVIVHRNSAVDDKFRKNVPFSRWTDAGSISLTYRDLSRSHLINAS